MVRSLWKIVWQFLLKLKNGLLIQSRSCIHGHLSQRNENICLHKNLYPNVHNGFFIHNIQKLETTRMPFNGWMVKQTMEASSDQIRSVTQSCPTLCDPMNRSMPGLPVHHQLPEFTQTHVHRVSDAIQPSHPLSSPSPPAPNPSQHQSLFQWVNSSHEVAKVLEFQL